MNVVRGKQSRIDLMQLVPVLGLVAFAAILFGIKLFLIGEYGNATPFWDQWDGEASRLYVPFLEGRLEWSHLLAPHNEHRSLISWLLALGLLSANGVWNPLLQMVVNAGLHVAFVCLLVNFLTQAAGPRFLPAALGFCLVLFGLPYGHENMLWGFQSCFYFLLLFGVGAIWLVTTADPFSARWWLGTGLSVCGFFSLASGAFIPAALAGVGAAQYLLGTRTTSWQIASVIMLGGLFVCGVMITPNIPAHTPLKAASPIQFLHALSGVMGWPIKASLLGPILRNAPVLLFVALMLRTRPPAEDRRWFLFALALWMFGQSVAIAYGRAGGFMASRYKDLFAVDVLTNFACLFILVQSVARSWPWALPVAAVWAATVLGCLGSSVYKHSEDELWHRLSTAQAQERNVRNYVITADIGNLVNQAHLQIPHPDPSRLATYLDNPYIRSVLPKNIGAPLKGFLNEAESTLASAIDGHNPNPSRPSAPVWGTYGSQGEATTGRASINFPSVYRGHAVEIPVAGDSRADGITIEIEQHARRRPLQVVANGAEQWGVATTTTRGRPFTVHISDANDKAWVAVGSPVAAGRWDAAVEGLLSRWDAFVIIGSVMAVSLVTFFSLAPTEPVL